MLPKKAKLPKHEAIKQKDFSHLLSDEFAFEHRYSTYRRAKRVIDIVASIAFMIVLSPVLLIITIAIKLDSKGNAIFSHERIGQSGKPFILHKFRTMYQNVDAHEFAPQQPNDARITKVGRFLRRTSLDELPQLWNVLKGDMSIIGPRPEMAFIVQTYSPLQRARLMATPGITGLWQIAGRKDIPLHENVEYDLHYIENQSLLLDLIILLKTIIVVISGKGAY